jgi:hypothetical protein
LWTDASVVSAFSAALDHPDYFQNDALLSDQRRPKGYIALHVLLIRKLTKITNDYGYSYCLLIIPSLFLHLTGYYFLGRFLFKSRGISIILTGLSLVTVCYGLSDYWGFFIDAQPRFLFHAILPYLLIFTFWSIDRPRWWPVLFVSCGLIFYIHSISGLAIGWMFWFALTALKEKTISSKMKFLLLLVSGLIFLVLMSPIIYFYFINIRTMAISKSDTVASIPFSLAYQYFSSMFSGMLDIKAIAENYVSRMLSYLILPLGFVGGVISIFLPLSHKEKKKINFIMISILALLIFGLLLPWIEYRIESYFSMMPMQIDFSRNLRYTIPLFDLLILYPIYWLISNKSNFSRVQSSTALLIGIFCLFGFTWNSVRLTPKYGYTYENIFFSGIKCLTRGNLFCPTSYEQESRRVIKFIRDELPNDSVFISIPDHRLSDAIRYRGLKSVALSDGDISRTILLDMQESMNLNQISKKWNAILENQSTTDQIDAFVSLACENNVSHLLIDGTYSVNQITENGQLNILLETNSFRVTEILSCE